MGEKRTSCAPSRTTSTPKMRPADDSNKGPSAQAVPPSSSSSCSSSSSSSSETPRSPSPSRTHAPRRPNAQCVAVIARALCCSVLLCPTLLCTVPLLCTAVAPLGCTVLLTCVGALSEFRLCSSQQLQDLSRSRETHSVHAGVSVALVVLPSKVEATPACHHVSEADV